MPPDAQRAMRDTLAKGPALCPPALFSGDIASIVRGLKAHANTIAHSRHVALEESFPRARALMGQSAFHEAAETHLADREVLRRPLARIGTGFAARLGGIERNVAALEWAWLEAHGAADAAAFDLQSIHGLGAEELISVPVMLHPAARLVERPAASPLIWDGYGLSSRFVLITRPHHEVLLTEVEQTVARLITVLDRPRLLGSLLEQSSTGTTTLVSTGALTRAAECPE